MRIRDKIKISPDFNRIQIGSLVAVYEESGEWFIHDEDADHDFSVAQYAGTGNNTAIRRGVVAEMRRMLKEQIKASYNTDEPEDADYEEYQPSAFA